MKINKTSIRLLASAKPVIHQFLHLPGEDRVKHVWEGVKKLSEQEVQALLSDVLKDFSARHRGLDSVFAEHFDMVSRLSKEDFSSFSNARKQLLGAYFTKEYSIQSAALFNPSIVAHPEDLENGSRRFIMSFRATGEGHISSIIFKTGTIEDGVNITLHPDPVCYTALRKNKEAVYTREFIQKRLAALGNGETRLPDQMPRTFTAASAIQILNTGSLSGVDGQNLLRHLEEIFDTNYELQAPSGMPLNEMVLFPHSKTESMGMEDLRLVRFSEGDVFRYYGLYTAYDGKQIRTQLLETEDFRSFKIRALYGAAISDKGMALFPEKLNGKYVMVSRQGGERIQIMVSEDLYFWDGFQLLLEPRYPWELVQLGNCGSPLKTEKGWLLLTHGVGPMRTYVISAILLDLNDPTRVIGRLDQPLIRADESEREGYVPNVVYTCGCLQHGDVLIIPYAMSDAATGFATLDLKDLFQEMNLKPSI